MRVIVRTSFVFIIAQTMLVCGIGQVFFGKHAIAASASGPMSTLVYYAPMNYIFDGKQLVAPSDQKGFIYQNNVYVSLRFMAYALNKAVGWDPATYTVTISEPNVQQQNAISTIKLNWMVKYTRPVKAESLSSQQTTSPRLSAELIQTYQRQIHYVIDGVNMQPLALSGLIYNNRLYVPIRFVSEALGMQVEWDQKTYSVVAQSPVL